MDYTVVTADDPQKFVNAVNTLMAGGYLPVGGASCSTAVNSNTGVTDTRFVQALVKPERVVVPK